MTQVINNHSDEMKLMLANLKKWSKENTLEESIEIMETHSKLMVNYQKLPNVPLNEIEMNQLRELIAISESLMDYLKSEKDELVNLISQMNQSSKIATQYIKSFSESYFIDKDF